MGHESKFIHPERHKAIESALENKDYGEWKEAVGENCRAAQIISEDNFPKLIEAHELRKQANEIRKELGLEGRHGMYPDL